MLGKYTEIVDGKRVALEHLKSEKISSDDIFNLQFTLIRELGFVYKQEISGLSEYHHVLNPDLKIFYSYDDGFDIQYKDNNMLCHIEEGMCLYDVVETFLDGIRSVWQKS